ncbi:E3 ubiquitin-protein ligase RNF216 [Aspergillus mulundensis]|uniref:RING-type domain-containing protein n=1 Tax=Aspergillus mulundensis TaxID=1810919 RepID=A0A3D8RX51_9EURO|nr:hypothetical protein DSM5745_05489 [Aspergillus mulundensis]RDW78637.1 hypothetical protein DSM5745_05489 [Aspergillus mulundensis]
MDQAIYISSDGEPDDDQSAFSEDDDFQEQLAADDWFAAYLDTGITEEGLPGRPPKRQRVHGPEDAIDGILSTNPLASRGLEYPGYPQAATSMAPATDGTVALFAQVLEMFPDISHAYVLGLMGKHKVALGPDAGQTRGFNLAIARDAIYEEILGQKSYPKQDNENSKRKREESEDEDIWKSGSLNANNSHGYCEAAAALLAIEFPWIPMSHIRKVLSAKERLYHAFIALYSDDKVQYVKLKSQRSTNSPKKYNPLRDTLAQELNAAKKQVGKLQTTLRKKKEEEEAEKANEEEHIRTGNTIECQCCYSDAPANRCLPCDGDGLHFFCFTCLRRSAENQIGMMKYTIQCFDVGGCQARFERSQLREVLGSSIMEKLDSLQQEDEIRLAGLDGLEDCPFCSYKAVLPSVEEDREFRCENSSCKVVSCRLCKAKSHIPLTCDEFRKDKGLSERHQVEEAMSNALIRKCPKCQIQIIKEYGCNKMHCTNCHTLMCYLCQKDITKEGYDHFGRGTCLQDDTRAQDREHREIQKAEREAIDKILAENPDITEEQIRVGHEKPNVSRDPQLHPAAHMRDVLRAMRAEMAAQQPQQHQHANHALPPQAHFQVYPRPAPYVPYPMNYGGFIPHPHRPDINAPRAMAVPGVPDRRPAQPIGAQPYRRIAAADNYIQNVQNPPAFQPQQRLPQDPTADFRPDFYGPF